MGRHSPGHSYSHNIVHLGEDEYEISWTVDFYYRDSRLRFPRRVRRLTNEKGALRFCKKWKLEFPGSCSK
jgi:hypothetical protein